MTRGGAAPGVVVHRDKQLLAVAVAARLVTPIDAQAATRSAIVVSPAARRATALLASLARSAARDAVDWRAAGPLVGRRAVPARPATPSATRPRPARRCSTPCRCDPARVHPMAPRGRPVRRRRRTPRPARYAHELAARPRRGGPRPGAGVRRASARRRARRARRVAVPRAPRAARHGRHGGRRPRLAEAAASADLADVPRRSPRPGGLAPGGRRGQGRRRRPGTVAAPARVPAPAAAAGDRTTLAAGPGRGRRAARGRIASP